MGEEPKQTTSSPSSWRNIAGLAEFPALSRSIEQVLLKVDEEASIQHITNVILKDYSLTLRILRTANSSLNNRSGRQIHSISHAVTLLGVEAVREMATGVVLLEHFRKHSPGLKELILLSLLTANHAREVADRVGYPKREEAYLCGMFRNLGEVLVACYHPRGYAAVLLRVQEDRIPVVQACDRNAGVRLRQRGKGGRGTMEDSGERSRMHERPGDPAAPRALDGRGAAGSDHSFRPQTHHRGLSAGAQRGAGQRQSADQ